MPASGPRTTAVLALAALALQLASAVSARPCAAADHMAAGHGAQQGDAMAGMEMPRADVPAESHEDCGEQPSRQTCELASACTLVVAIPAVAVVAAESQGDEVIPVALPAALRSVLRTVDLPPPRA